MIENLLESKSLSLTHLSRTAARGQRAERQLIDYKGSDLVLRDRRHGTESRMQEPEAASASSTMTNGRSSRVTTCKCWASSGGCRN